MSDLTFPTIRMEYPGIDAPLFISDINNATYGITRAMKSLIGSIDDNDTSFYINFISNFKWESTSRYSIIIWN